MLLLELLSLLAIQIHNFILGQIILRHSVSMVPFLLVDIHFKSIHRLPSQQEVLLSQILLTNLAIMLSDLSVEGTGDFGGLAIQQLNCLVPLFGRNSGFYGFLEAACFNIMVHGRFSLLLMDQPVAPAFLQVHDQARVGTFSKVHSLAKGEAFAVAIECLLEHFHLLVELAGLLVHTGNT